jgi:hypothetical protein
MPDHVCPVKELERANEILRTSAAFRADGTRPPTQVIVDYIDFYRETCRVEPMCRPRGGRDPDHAVHLLRPQDYLRTGRALHVPRSRASQRAGGHVTREVMISERSTEVTDRAVPGHWEGGDAQTMPCASRRSACSGPKPCTGRTSWRDRRDVEWQVAWVNWYNTSWLHSSIGHLPPIRFETIQRKG